MKIRIELQEQKLEKLFESFNAVQDEEVKAYLAKFLCIRTSGFLETSFKNLIYEYVSGTCPKPIQKYVSSKIKGVTNLSYERLVGVMKTIHLDWAVEFESKITDEQRSSLNSVISNRNNIAHGENDSISYQ